MDGVCYLPPTGYLLLVENARSVGISETPRGNRRGLGYDQPRRCPLSVIFSVETGRHIPRTRPATGERRHENARWRENLAELQRVKQCWNDGPPPISMGIARARSPSARMIQRIPGGFHTKSPSLTRDTELEKRIIRESTVFCRMRKRSPWLCLCLAPIPPWPRPADRQYSPEGSCS
jgi:hypothetical protein